MAFEMDAAINMLPAEKGLPMPLQRLKRWAPGKVLAAGANPPGTWCARIFVATVTLLLTAFGTYEIYRVISPADRTWLQIVFAMLFAITFSWIAFSCASAVLGFLRLLIRKEDKVPLVPLPEAGRTALLMPVYNENPSRVMASLLAMGQGLVRLGAGEHFDIFVLSDTRDADHAAEEERAATALKARLGGKIAVYYRRREINHHKKAGNIADFVTRWGGAYDHMIVLDADSEMEAQTLVSLARAMAADPKAGILQTLPLLRNRLTLFARMTQFAGRVYGPVIAEGLCAWHGRDGNYWGHNAIIRVKAFAEAAGLPELKGRKPFGGHIMSHDFVEAALMRRAGWAVYMLPRLGGTYEETPPSLVDLATRDRRWCQGNLQHMKVIASWGLHPASRVHFLQGIMSYLASPLWFLMLITGLGLSAIAQYTEPNYFPDGFSLFPAWPVFDPDRALDLFTFTAIILLLPKLLGVLVTWRDEALCRGCGGTVGLLQSFVAEVFLSALLSPVMMLIQTRFVFDVLIGQDSGWNAQNRDDRAMPFLALVQQHWSHVFVGLAMCVIAYYISWQTMGWLLPIIVGLLLAPVTSWITGLIEPGVIAKEWNVFRIPEEGQVQRQKARAGEAYLQPAE
jgi:membrane glycosyltransferase